MPLHPQPVVVIVPVYNSTNTVSALVDSLRRVYPVPRSDLFFHFIDDASTEPQLESVWKDPFFDRTDVQVRGNSNNLGFVKTVNTSILRTGAADIVLLNSDTQIFDDVVATLQQEAYSEREIASVTPLTNNGTIASLFAFSAGGADLPGGATAAQVARVVAELALEPSPVAAPTGVGFCLYLKREALNQVGLLDRAYGAGYGDETDWCQRAIRLRWKHVISPRAFVYHAGTKSFTASAKKRLIEAHSRIIHRRYPRYAKDLRAYCLRDPLKFHRLVIVLELLGRLSTRRVVLLTLHTDPYVASTGGTERHALRLQCALMQHGCAVVLAIPKGPLLRITASWSGHNYLDEQFEFGAARPLFELMAAGVDLLHVQHVKFWPDEAIDALLSANFANRITTLHDFVHVCPSTHLVGGETRSQFCGVERDLKRCNSCLHNWIGYTGSDIQEYRRKSADRLARFDRLVVPSEASLRIYADAFGSTAPHLIQRIRVQSHDLSYLHDHVAAPCYSQLCDTPRVLAFVGNLNKNKGAELIAAAAPALRAAGFEVEIAGRVMDRSLANIPGVPVTPYDTIEELASWLRQRDPIIVAHPSLTAESFCYAFYETLLLAPRAVPVVGCFGHPADVVKATGAGIVMFDMTVESLIAACKAARDQYSTLQPQCRRFRDELSASISTPVEPVNFDQFSTRSHRSWASERSLNELSSFDFDVKRTRISPKSWRGRMAQSIGFMAQLREAYWNLRRELRAILR